MNLQNQAFAIAKDAEPKVGFDPISIITILLPLLVQCFQSQGTQDSPKEYLADHYDESTSSFDSSLVKRVRPQTRRAARKDGKGHLSREELDAITVATLEKARTADDDVVSAVMEEAS